MIICLSDLSSSIEGNPFIIRFKTLYLIGSIKDLIFRIEGNPFIIRFKTGTMLFLTLTEGRVLKVIHL